MDKLFVQVERVEDLIGRADNYFTPPEAKEHKPITNADRIRSYTDEELADYIACVGKANNGCQKMSINCQESCNKCWLDWLKQEVTTDG